MDSWQLWVAVGVYVLMWARRRAAKRRGSAPVMGDGIRTVDPEGRRQGWL